MMDVIVVHCSWSERYGDNEDGDFIEVWADSTSSLPGIAKRVLEADSDLRAAFKDAGIDDDQRDTIMREWLEITTAGGQYKPVWDSENEWAICLGWWDVERCEVHGAEVQQ